MSFVSRAIACAAVVAVLTAATLPAMAEETEEEEPLIPGEFSANVGFFTDYRFRGVSQTENEPALQGGIDWAHDSGFYLGTWGSNVEFADAHLELDVYGGYASEFRGVSYDLGFVYYWYPGAGRSQDFDYYEFVLGLGYDFEVAAVSSTIAYTPENFGDTGDGLYLEGGVSVPLPYEFSFDGTIGYQFIEEEVAFGIPDYLNWSLGLSRSFMGLDFSLAYIDTDEPSCGDACGATVLFSVSKSF